MNAKQLITAAEAAGMLSISRSSFYEKVLAKGLLTPIRLGKSVRFRPSDIEELVEHLANDQATA